ncbi:glycosyltransferase [Cohnella sp.]|uniref:glycosyltransferase n=1 Tax=Cohnella sp. TaxID=1883426 RepID=UPI003565B2D3
MAKSNTNPKVSIIICTYTRARLLRQTLHSLEHLQDIKNAEVIVVDNGSRDDTSSVVREFTRRLTPKAHIRYVFEHRKSLSIARNTGIEHARGSIVAFLDDDAIPTADWLSSLCAAFERYPNAAAVGGMIQPHFETFRPDWLIKQLEQPFAIIHLGDKERKYPRKLYPCGANLAIRKDALGDSLRFPASLGSKGNSLLSREESWLFSQLRKKGGELYYIPRMKVTHFIGAERLCPEWIKSRYYYQGAALAGGEFNLVQRIGIKSRLTLKKINIAFKTMITIAPGEKLLNECRMESIRGSMEMLRSGGTAPLRE